MAPPKRRNRTEIRSLSESAGTSKINKKIRDLQRLLRKEDIQPNVKIESERALKALQADLETAKKANKDQKISQRYFKIKFFELKKAKRRLNNALKTVIQENNSESSLNEFKKKEIDYYYVCTFPANKKYSALFAQGATDDEIKNKYIEEVKEKIEQGTLPSGIKDNKPVALEYKL